MDLQKIAVEIGLFETAVNWAKVRDSTDVIKKTEGAMPFPDADVKVRVKEAAKWLLSFGKRKYLFLTPEIALIEAMGELADKDIETIVIIPCDLEEEAQERLKNNMPCGIVTSVLEEPYFPQDFLPANGLIVICGYLAGERTMVLQNTYRMVEHYGVFYGKKVFVPYTELGSAENYNGWLEINQQRISEKWRHNHEQDE